MIHIETLIFNSFRVNTYIVYDETGECVIVDPACYGEEEEMSLDAHIADKGLKPVLLLNTHCHIDHILGVPHIRDNYLIPFCAHEGDKPVLENGHIMGDLFGFQTDPFPPIDRLLSNEETIHFGNSTLLALHVPGHSRGSLAFYSEIGNFVITGDALFAGSIGRTDLPGGDYDMLLKSIRTRLFTLPGETVIYPGHGESSTVAHEKATNPFFR